MFHSIQIVSLSCRSSLSLQSDNQLLRQVVKHAVFRKKSRCLCLPLNSSSVYNQCLVRAGCHADLGIIELKKHM